MGIIAHHAIVVTGYDDKTKQAHELASSIFSKGQVSAVSTSPINHYLSFAVFTDGSKEGWDDSDTGDERRDTFIEWLEGQRFDDGSSPLHWVEINYGEIASEAGAKITRSTWGRPEHRIG